MPFANAAAHRAAEKALETTGGDPHAAQFHPMQEKRQHRFTGRLAMGLDPIQDAVAEERKVA